MSFSKHVLVTGGAGFIGSHLVDALVLAGHRVRILDSLVPQVHHGEAPAYLNPQAEFLPGDVCNRALVARALDGIEVVFHQAAEVGVGQSMYEPERYMRANTLGTTILLEEISHARHRIEKLVVASSMSIYGEGAYACAQCGDVAPPPRSGKQLRDHLWELQCPRCSGPLSATPTNEDKPLAPFSVYAISKQDQEQLCLVMGRAYGVPTVALRYFNGYGTRQALSNPYTGLCAIFCSRLLNQRPPLIFEDGEQARDFIHVSDIVQANLLALETAAADFCAVNIGSGVSSSVNHVAALLCRALGSRVEPEIVGQYREGDIRHCVADISRARRLLGFTPKVTLELGLAELVDWVQTQSGEDFAHEARHQLAARNLMY